MGLQVGRLGSAAAWWSRAVAGQDRGGVEQGAVGGLAGRGARGTAGRSAGDGCDRVEAEEIVGQGRAERV